VAGVRAASKPTRSTNSVPSYEIITERLASGAFSEFESKRILRGIAGLATAFPDGSLDQSAAEAVDTATALNYPVVLKAQSRQLLHKTEAGGVVLNIRSADEVIQGWNKLQDNIKAYRHDLILDGVLVERMSSPGTEFIVGGRNDPDWGPVALIGLGGIFSEALQDVRLIVPGLSQEAILWEIGKLKGSALLKGFRGAAPPDLAALAGVVSMIGEVISRHPEIREIDLNPVVVHASGVSILDA